ncbi:MAG: InlB B-repeat-containing protein [Prevotella sp.]|nr:InlB B-repeat-containing protein [Prevotella sp.]
MKTITRMTLLLLLALASPQLTWADNVTLQDAGGTKYVTMPTTGTNTLTLNDASVGFFKVYDDGGAEENYSGGCSGYLLLKAPAGYKLQISGTIHSEEGYDKLTIYDGETTDATPLVSEMASNNGISIGEFFSTGQSLLLYFCSDGSGFFSGLDLDVIVCQPDKSNTITVKTATGGVLYSDKTTAKYGETVTLTWTHETGYVLESISVTDIYGRSISVVGGSWYNAATHFNMPVSDATVTPKFVKATTSLDGLSVDMPRVGTRICDIATGVTSFKVYDNGGAEGDYSDGCDGYLVVTAPAGYRLQLTGTLETENGCDYLTVFDGTTTEAEMLLSEKTSSVNYEPEDIGLFTSSGQSIMLFFHSDGSNVDAGLDLEITLFDPNVPNAISVTTAEGGTLKSDKASAKFGETITLTETHQNGYILKDVKVTDVNGRSVEVTGGSWSNVIGSFTMPASSVTVTPTFIQASTIADGLFINMPKEGTLIANISTGVKSFKVYDNGGAEGDYTSYCDGYLMLTAPQGFRIQLTGSMAAEDGCDYIVIYDGTTTEGEQLLPQMFDKTNGEGTDLGFITSSGQSMTVFFHSDGSQERRGLDLNVYVFNPEDSQAITVNTAQGGAMTADKKTAKFAETVTLTSSHEKDYVLESTSVLDGYGKNIAVSGGTWYNDVASFAMPISPATVTPKFTTAKSAEDGIYLTMPKGNETLVTNITNGIKSFKIYSDGGPEGTYSDYCDATLVLTAPVGYMLQLTGSLTTESGCDFFYIYEGSNVDEEHIKFGRDNNPTGNDPVDIGTIATEGRSLTIFFHSDGSQQRKGLDLLAKLIPVTYTLSFDKNNASATGTMGDITLTYDEPKNLPANSFSRTAYDFAGWAVAANDTVKYADKAEVVNLASTQGAKVTIFAKWNPTVYDITYQLASGQLPEGKENPATYTIETPDFTLVNPVRTGYTFAGWTGTDLTEKTVTVTVTKGHYGKRSYTANWEANPYKVNFVANGGEGEMANQSFVYDTAQALIANTYTRKGYTFDGWNTKADGSGTAYADKQEVKNLTAIRDAEVKLYAQWKVIVYTISYDLAGGTLATENPVEYTIESESFTLTNPTREGYVFTGWTGTELEGAVTAVTIAKGSIGNRSYTATWHLIGDVNNDNKVDVADVFAILNVIANSTYDKVADQKADGKVDMADVQAVIDIITGKK